MIVMRLKVFHGAAHAALDPGGVRWSAEGFMVLSAFANSWRNGR